MYIQRQNMPAKEGATFSVFTFCRLNFFFFSVWIVGLCCGPLFLSLIRTLKFIRLISVFFYIYCIALQHTGLKQRLLELKDGNNKPNKKEQSHLLKHYVGDRFLLVQSTILVIVGRLFC